MGISSYGRSEELPFRLAACMKWLGATNLLFTLPICHFFRPIPAHWAVAGRNDLILAARLVRKRRASLVAKKDGRVGGLGSLRCRTFEESKC